MRALPPVPNINPAQPRMISTGKMKFTAAKARLGAQGQLLRDSVRYGRIIVLALPFYILQSWTQKNHLPPRRWR